MSDEKIKFGYETAIAAGLASPDALSDARAIIGNWQAAEYLIAHDFHHQHFRRSYRALQVSALKPSSVILRENISANLSFHPVPGAFFGQIMQSILQASWQETLSDKLLSPPKKQKVEEIRASDKPHSLVFARTAYNTGAASLFYAMKAQRLSLALHHSNAPVIEARFLGIKTDQLEDEGELAALMDSLDRVQNVPPLPQISALHIKVNESALLLPQSCMVQFLKPDLRAVYVLSRRAPSQLIDGKLAISGKLSFLVTDAVLAKLPAVGQPVSIRLVLSYDASHQIGMEITKARVSDMRLAPQPAEALMLAELDFEIDASDSNIPPLRLSQTYS